MGLPPVAIPKHITNMEKRITYLEKELKNEKKWLEISLKFIEDCNELEKKIEENKVFEIDRIKKEKKNDINFLINYCQSRTKAEKLYHEIKKGKFNTILEGEKEWQKRGRKK